MILFVLLYFLRSIIFFGIFCVTHGFFAEFSNFPTLCFNASRNIFFPIFHSVSLSLPLPSLPVPHCHQPSSTK
uniref:Putative secreted protein n=1 Tax=Xenopsylla cheopis TaxID=163159 RepID=A0A6M2DYJ4_XENCH